ncbi:biotin-independent malonate decarboxylase subunit beta [Rhizobium panacihumi]|uniref:biotin-independent malonate decarboxylase subunit beta n=1 Tax=Rhizobium panacihumi TaxID=2008450 RepID=UPI003D7BAB7C
MSNAQQSRPDWEQFLSRKSFIELSAAKRASSILDEGTGRVLLGPFDRLTSPWLPQQGIVTQADDGVVLLKGKIDGKPAIIASIESAFQGGSMGEVAGAKIAGALEQALKDHENGIPIQPVILFETGGVRLQEANLGLAVIAEIHAAIVALRSHVPVVGVVAGMVGCFGGMSLAASLCSHLIVTRQGRIGMNGPEVIEQEAGIQELDASDKKLIWSLIGGEQRYAIGQADTLVEDDADAIAKAVRAAFRQGVVEQPRSACVEEYLAKLEAFDPAGPAEPLALRAAWGKGETK